MNQSSHAVTATTPTSRIRDRAAAMLFKPVSGSQLTLLAGSFISTIANSTLIGHNLCYGHWAPSIFLVDVPRRLGSNEPLDCATDALVSAHASFSKWKDQEIYSIEALAKYSRALRALREGLNDAHTAQSSSTLCAVMLLITCKGILGLGSGEYLWSGHVEGALRLLQARKGLKPRDEFEEKMFMRLRWSIVCLPLSFSFAFSLEN